MLPRSIPTLLCLGLFSLCSTQARQAKPTAHIAIQVDDVSGAVAPNAYVEILGATFAKNLETDSFGKLSVDLPIGSYDLTAIQLGFKAAKKRVDVQDTKDQLVIFVLELAPSGPVGVVMGGRIAEPTYASLPDKLDDESDVSLLGRHFDAHKFCSPCAGIEQQIKPASQLPFTITISTPESVVRVGADVRIKITMTNTSDRDVFYGSGTEPVVDVVVLDGSGKQVAETPEGMKIHDTDPNRQPHSGSFVRLALKPGKALSGDRIVSNEFDMKKPGNYTILAQRKDTASGTVVQSEAITVTVIDVDPSGAIVTGVPNTQLDSLPVDSVIVTPPSHDPEKSAYAITISTSRRVKVGSEVALHITTKNTSDKTIYRVVRSGGPHGRDLDISVRDSKGDSVHETPLGRKIHGTDQNREPWSGSVFTGRYPLRPGEVIEENFNLSEEYNFSKPGRYSVQVLRSDIVTEEEIKSHLSPQAVKSNTTTTLVR